jgi:hypothetical protein
VETLWENSGPARDRYISPEDEPLELMEDELETHVQQVWDYLKLDMQIEVRTNRKGILLGLCAPKAPVKGYAVGVQGACRRVEPKRL